MITAERYSSVAIILHWVMAISFCLMIASGLTMEYINIEKALKFNLYQWHKSLGVLLLVAFVLRVVWRFTHKPPAFPPSIHGFELTAAKAGHFLLYLFMFLVPFAGWLMVSSSVYGLPTIVFGWFEWPHIPNVAGNEEVSNFAKTAHWVLAWGFIALILGHIAAVIKHTFFDRIPIIDRMWWSGKTKNSKTKKESKK